jgi:hypothetical protein
MPAMPGIKQSNDNEQYNFSGPSSRHDADNKNEHNQTRLDKLLSSVRSDDSLLDLVEKLSGCRKDMSVRHKEDGQELKNTLDQMRESVLSMSHSRSHEVDSVRQQPITLLQRFEDLQLQHLSCFQAAQYHVTSDQIDSVRLLFMRQQQECGQAKNDIDAMRRLQEREDLVKVLEEDRIAMQRLEHQVEEGEAYTRNAMIAAFRLDESLREAAMKQILDQQLAQIETLMNNLVASHIQLKDVDLNKLTLEHIEKCSQKEDRLFPRQQQEERLKALNAALQNEICRGAESINDADAFSIKHAGRTRTELELTSASRERQVLDAILQRVEGGGHIRKHNAKFMDEMLEVILSTPNHPLKKLVNETTQDWNSRQKYSQETTVQAGHLTSLHSSAVERLALEDSTFNQWSSNKGETQGAVFLKEAIEIGGIPVEKRTAMQWEKAGIIDKGTVENASEHEGWKR